MGITLEIIKMTETKLEMLKVTNYLAFTGRFSPLGVHVCDKCRYQPSELLGWVVCNV